MRPLFALLALAVAVFTQASVVQAQAPALGNEVGPDAGLSPLVPRGPIAQVHLRVSGDPHLHLHLRTARPSTVLCRTLPCEVDVVVPESASLALGVGEDGPFSSLAYTNVPILQDELNLRVHFEDRGDFRVVGFLVGIPAAIN